MNNLPQIFLLLGPETGEKKLFIKEIIDKTKNALGEDPEIFRFYPFETDISQIISLLRNGSLFVPYRFIQIIDCHELSKEETSLLKGYLRNPSKDATLFLLTPLIQIDKKTMELIPKNNQKIFWELFENQKKGKITNFFRNKNMLITPEALDLFLDLVENTTEEIQNSCEALSSFFGPNSTITDTQIEEFIFHSKEENVFTLFEKIVQADFQGSLEILHKVLLSGEGYPVQIFGGLVWQFRRLLTFSTLLESHHQPADGYKKVNIKGKRNQHTYLTGAKNYHSSELKRIIVLIANWDTKLRETRAELHPLLMELFIYYAICKKGEIQTYINNLSSSYI